MSDVGRPPHWPTNRTTTIARWLLRAFARVVPAADRRDWLDEWNAELWQLQQGPVGTWPLMVFLMGAGWHGLWEWKEGWSLASIGEDVRQALRMLARSPGFAVTAVLMLGAAVGLSTAMFTVLERAILSEPPWPAPDRIVVVDQQVGMTAAQMGPTRWSYARYLALVADVRSIQLAAGYERRTLTLTELGNPAVVTAEIVTPSLFPLLGIDAIRGRLFGPAEEDAGSPVKLAVVSEAFWREQMGGSPEVVGRILTLDQQRVEIIGVMPPRFRGLSGDADVWLPMAALRDFENDSALDDPWNSHFLVLARLADGVSLETARLEVRAFGATLQSRFAAPVAAAALQFGADVLSFREARSNPRARASMLAVFGAVILLLLVATANLAALMLARGAVRRREVAVRLSLGAARGRILQQLVTESLVLAALGGVLGTVIAWASLDVLGVWLSDALGTMGQRAIQYLDPTTLELDGRVLAFATLITAAAGIGCGLLPAWQAASTDPNACLRGGRNAEADRGWTGGVAGRRLLIVVQVSVAIVLLSGATVMARSLLNLQRIDLGFQDDHLLTATYALTPSDRLAGVRPGTFHTEFLDRVRAVPGVIAATIGSVPLGGPTWRAIVLSSEGRPELAPASHTWIRLQPVPEGHLEAMGIELLEGRAIESFDTERSQPVIVLGETAARYLFPNGYAIGRRIRLNWSEFGLGAVVVGIARDIVAERLGEPPGLQAYVSVRQAARLETGVLIRTSQDPMGVASAVRGVLAGMNPNIALTSVMPMEARMSGMTARPRVVALLLSVFGSAALLLVGAGLYGSIAYGVARRTHEIGLRLSLGAAPASLVVLVLREALGVTAVGALLGLGTAVWALRFLEALVFETASVDPVAMLAGCLALLAVAGAAAFIPARRALRVDPMVALRSD